MSNSIPAIKPIETRWHGYRFRSRLEARWAVFFERLGLRWEYEPEGFVLPDQSRYLPDFYLPDQDLYVEIKPAINTSSQTVYLAGKFNSDWRSSIVPSFNRLSLCSGSHEIIDKLIDGFHRYNGPYNAGGDNDHYWEIPCTHGICGLDIGETADDQVPIGVFTPETDRYVKEDLVFTCCYAAIQRCDILFAWIDSLDCYGTLAEIGYAKGLNKKIFLGFSKNLYSKIPRSGILESGHDSEPNYHHDLWFVEKMAQRSVVTETALDAYRQTVGLAAQELKKIQQMPHWLLIAGNPHPDEYQAFEGFNEVPRAVGALHTTPGIGINAWERRENEAVIAALAAARSARFEHGEQP